MARALAFEDRSSDSMTAQLWRVAQALAREALRRGATHAKPLTLEMLDGFRGTVLGAVVQRLESREEAFRLFKREHLLNGRNHHRALKRELTRTRELVRALGDDVGAPDLRTLLEIGRTTHDRRPAPAPIALGS